MFDSDRWQEIYHVLTKNKLRTFLTAFGVFWGLFMLIVLMGSGKGLENGATSDFSQFATNSVYMWGQSTSMPYKGFKEGRWIGFDNEDTRALEMGLKNAEVVAPKVQLGGYRGKGIVKRKKYQASNFEVTGDIPEVIKISPRSIVLGRWLNHTDLDEKRKVAVIGKQVQEVLFEEDEDPIGDYINIGGVYFLVVGVYDMLAASSHGGDRELEKIFTPITTFQQAFNYGNSVGWYSIMSKDEIPVSQVEEEAKAILKERNSIHPDDYRAIGSFNAEEEFTKMTNLFLGINILIWVVGIGTLLAGVIGVSNIMLIVVKERTKEIGIRKAIGATPMSIISQIVLESVILTSVAGYFGLTLGVGLLELINSATSTEEGGMFRQPEVDFNAAIISLIILIIAGGLAGIIPARKASAVDPIVALRSE
ncbi:MAG: ABC transporter permease [Flavobacteriales bacterium]|jgi:putative ABC transport system permease protein|nr:ABC transporter permease [Flavobacteriales bacterium]MBT3962642.1 ABC transporter permease [Flavobacteriales bacterium]MBT4704796.1 ABC transporter permease [Flavobacteriales bacterium]MBT4929456.1 ABC transporter permease [Flavobacteriales bacterium]MBT5133587.1 ABC transporter permease [Flavobacteriales bacterium]